MTKHFSTKMLKYKISLPSLKWNNQNKSTFLKKINYWKKRIDVFQKRKRALLKNFYRAALAGLALKLLDGVPWFVITQLPMEDRFFNQQICLCICNQTLTTIRFKQAIMARKFSNKKRKELSLWHKLKSYNHYIFATAVMM